MDLSLVTLHQLRYLLAVDELRSFRRAAQRCHVSQPGLSMQVQKLEESLGLTLFDRSRQPVIPTDVGLRVIEQARVIVRESERLGQIATSAQDVVAGPYRLGVIPTLAPTLLPRLLPKLVAQYPQVILEVEEVQTQQMVERLQRDDLDGGFASTPLGVPGVHEQVVFREPLYVYLPKKHPLAKKSAVRERELLSDTVWLLAEGHCFGDQVLHLCKAQRPFEKSGHARVEFRSGGFETLLGLVDAGLGMTVLPALVVARLPDRVRRSQVRPFVEPVPIREVSLLSSRLHLRRAISEVLCSCLAESLPAPLVLGPKRQRRLSPIHPQTTSARPR